MLQPGVVLVHGRRRSVDVGGLSLAMSGRGLGHGWGGWEEREKGEISYAELLSDMYNQTVLTVNEQHVDLPSQQSPDPARSSLIDSLDTWNFEPHKLPEEDVLSCTLILFEALFRMEGMQDHVGVSLNQLFTFLRHLRQMYRCQNDYHNFKHALDVLQAIYYFLHTAGMVPSVSILREADDRMWKPDKSNSNTLISCLENEDLFALYIAAIGHDVAHPGFTNVFMKNAKTPLSAVYDDTSALEQMHLAILLRVLRYDALGSLLDRPGSGTTFRRLICNAILSTDMSVHKNFMTRFKKLIDGGSFRIDERKILVCQALIKCADISNSSRPHRISRYWANMLMNEWTSQAGLEKHFCLPASVQPSDSPESEAKGQVFFISTFAKPLFDLVARAIPEMSEFAEQCTSNLGRWQTLWTERSAEARMNARQAQTDPDDLILPPPASAPFVDFLNAFPLTLPPSFITTTLTPHEEHQSLAWPTVSRTHSSSSSDVSSESDQNVLSDTTIHSPSPPLSPSESTGSSISPHSEFSATIHTGRPPSAASTCSTTLDASAAIRAAYQASVRKKKSINRNSWNVNPGIMGSNATPPSSRSSLNFGPYLALSPPISPSKSSVAIRLPGRAQAAVVVDDKPHLIDTASPSVLINRTLSLDTNIPPS